MSIVIESLAKSRLTTKDIERLCDLERSIFGEEGYPRYFFRQCSEIFTDTFLIARDKDIIIGYLLAAPKENSDIAWILSMAIDETYRRKGIGTAMIKTLTSKLKERGINQILVTVEPSNVAAKSLYAKLGFNFEKILENYHGKGHHRILMERKVV